MAQTTAHTPPREEAIAKLRELIRGAQYCMFGTVDSEGNLRSRPMAVQQTEYDGDLWFFTGKSTGKIIEIRNQDRVNLSFSNADDQEYVSISGTAELVDDRDKAKELWNPFYRAWFPQGVDDPDLTLIRVRVDRAEYWDSPSSAVVHLFGVVKAMVTGKPANPGDHQKIEM
ncbi:MAG: pyridoxamine 5'-phosphate oxidase family protein [Bryobacteraceae bacterium]|nr:pyridoxamine 5'-phosphate oxidase family protein [Bryobacteraceae bacterium]